MLMAGSEGAGLAYAELSDGATWGRQIADLAIEDGAAHVHFEQFFERASKVLFPPTYAGGYSNMYMRSGLDQEAATKQDMEAAGWQVHSVGLFIGAGHRRAARRSPSTVAGSPGQAGSPGDITPSSVDACICASPDAVVWLSGPVCSVPGGVAKRAGNGRWMWEHKEVSAPSVPAPTAYSVSLPITVPCIPLFRSCCRSSIVCGRKLRR